MRIRTYNGWFVSALVIACLAACWQLGSERRNIAAVASGKTSCRTPACRCGL